jgi:hypothetical protein
MRIRNLALLFLVGCKYPYPILVAASGMLIPPSAMKKPLSVEGARVEIVPDAAATCAFLGLATGVGGNKDHYQGTTEQDMLNWRAEARVALRNAVGAAGGTHVIVDGEELFGGPHMGDTVILRGRAFRC